VPHVASKASVLQSQHPGLSKRERTADAQDSPSPFAALLDETAAGAAPEPRHQPARTREPGAVAALRNHGQRGEAMRTEHSQRPQWRDGDDAADAPAEVTEPTDTTETTSAAQPEEEQAADQSETLTGEAALDIAAAPAQPAGDEPAAEQSTTVDAAPAVAAAVEPPPAPEQPVVANTPSQPSADVAAASPAATAAADAPAPAPSIPASVDPVAPTMADGGTSEPAPTSAAQTPQAAEAAQTPEAPAAAPAPSPHQRPAAISTHAKPAIAAAVSAESGNSPESSTASDATAPAAPTTGAQHAQTESAPQHGAHAQTPEHAAAQQGAAPETSERPQTGSTVSEFVQANHPTPDSGHGAHLQTGREFGQSVAATAHAAHNADASNPLVSAPVPLESLAVEIATRAQAGRSRFEIRLDPPELGRIDVRLDIDRSGNVTSRLVVDKAETLDALRRDAHQLERALQDAGLKTSDSGLQFSLRDHSFGQRNDRNDPDGTRVLVADAERPAAEGAPMAYGLALRSGGRGIDIRV